MVFFFCGAPKNGSHFQYNIVLSALEMTNTDFGFGNLKILHDRNFSKCSAMLQEYDRKNNKLFICKGHFGTPRERDFLLSLKHIKIFHIWRNIKDAIISQYHSDINMDGINHGNFDRFYWKYGRFFAYRQIEYRNAWDSASGHEKVFNINFEDLVFDFCGKASMMLNFAGIHIDDMEKLKERSSIENSRVRHGDPEGKFFRKGIVGEHKELMLSNEIINDLNALLANGSGNIFRNIKYELDTFRNCNLKSQLFVGHSKYMLKKFLRIV